MANLKPAQIAEVKGKGFLINRGTEIFSGRIVPRGTVFSPDDLKTVSEISSKFGNGKVIPTTRLGLEFSASKDKPNGKIEISDITLGYNIVDFDTSPTELQPVWRITLKDGSKYYINA